MSARIVASSVMDVAELRGNVVGLILLREPPRPKYKNWARRLVRNWSGLGGRKA
jgi:hypothetical protein